MNWFDIFQVFASIAAFVYAMAAYFNYISVKRFIERENAEKAAGTWVDTSYTTAWD